MTTITNYSGDSVRREMWVSRRNVRSPSEKIQLRAGGGLDHSDSGLGGRGRPRQQALCGWMQEERVGGLRVI